MVLRLLAIVCLLLSSGAVADGRGLQPAGVPPAIASNFSVAAALKPSAPAHSSAPDVVGAFRFNCSAGQISYDDPIVYPGQPGRSHLHQFFGNTAANARSTYASLRTSGDSTCISALNRSAYWIPAMLNGRGQVVRPDFVSIYYKRLPTSSPDCQTQGEACVDLPRGLRFVFGYNMIDPQKLPTGSGYFTCQGPSAGRGKELLIAKVARFCPPGAQIGLVINAPSCWDGIHIDSADHRAHVAYAFRQPGVGIIKCPASHPYVIPTFTLSAWYTTDATTGDWKLSSDTKSGMEHPGGTTLHADWWGAWDEKVMQMWMRGCIDRMLSCSAGNLGNGQALRQSDASVDAKIGRLVPVPRRG